MEHKRDDYNHSITLQIEHQDTEQQDSFLKPTDQTEKLVQNQIYFNPTTLPQPTYCSAQSVLVDHINQGLRPRVERLVCHSGRLA